MSQKTNKIGLIILAAGASRRMNGKQKQLLEIKGKTLLRKAFETAADSVCRPIAVVLGANADKLKREIEDFDAQVVINEDWETGLSSSIEIGIKHLIKQNSELSAILIMLCDQPLITTKIINELAEIYEKSGKPIVACKYEETIGVPAIFSREIFGELCEIKGDKGARNLIEKYAEKLETIEVPEAAFDIDTTQDFEKLKDKI